MMDSIVYTFKVLTPEELIKHRNELIQVAIEAYSNLFSKTLAESEYNLFEETMRNEETWNLLFEHARCIVCQHQHKIVGAAYVVSSGHPWKYFDSAWSYIRMVGVLPMYAQQGIGKKLTMHCIRLAKDSGESVLALHTSEIQEAARYIYESFGFTIHKELDPIWGKRYWLYTLNLS